MEQEQQKFEKITIHFIDHKDQRYDTVGDYYNDDEDGSLCDNSGMHFYISKLANYRSHAVLIHELVEYFSNLRYNVSVEDVDKFDKEYEAGTTDEKYSEPGLDPLCLYHVGHMKADVHERAFILGMGDDWINYENEIESLPYVESKL